MKTWEKPAKNCHATQPRFTVSFVEVKMAGLGRADVIKLSPTELSRKLKEVGLPKSLTDVLEGKGRRQCVFLGSFI